MTDNCGRENRNGEECKLSAGWGTDHNGEGACKFHGGASTGPSPEAAENNQNAQTHGLTADLENYFENLTESDREEVWELSESIQDRVRANGNHVDILDRKLSRRVSIKIHIADHATDYALAEELMQTIEVDDDGAVYEKDIPHALLDAIRQFDAEIFRELKKLGALDDPESQKADALADGIDLSLSSEDKDTLDAAFGTDG